MSSDDQTTQGSDYFAQPAEPEHVPPARVIGPLADLKFGEPATDEQPEQAPEAESEEPRTLTPDQVLDALAGPPEDEYEDPDRTAALAQLEQERATWEAVRTGEPVKQVAAEEAEYEDALRELVSANPGIDSREAAKAMQPIIDRLSDQIGDVYAYHPATVRFAFEAVGGSEKYDAGSEAQQYAEAFRGAEARRTKDGRVELIPSGRKVDKFGFG